MELSGKRWQLLKEALPAGSRVAALWNPAQPVSVRRAIEDAARALGLQLCTIEVAAPDEILAGFEEAATSGVEALERDVLESTGADRRPRGKALDPGRLPRTGICR